MYSGNGAQLCQGQLGYQNILPLLHHWKNVHTFLMLLPAGKRVGGGGSQSSSCKMLLSCCQLEQVDWPLSKHIRAGDGCLDGSGDVREHLCQFMLSCLDYGLNFVSFKYTSLLWAKESRCVVSNLYLSSARNRRIIYVSFTWREAESHKDLLTLVNRSR